MKDKLLEEMFNHQRWEDLIEKADEKGINKSKLRKMCDPKERQRIYYLIATEQYEISPPHIVLIPKDKPNEFRECKANEDEDRIILTLINDCVMDMFHDMIHHRCTSYQKGKSCGETVQLVSKEMMNLYNHEIEKCYLYKLDLSKYFDSVNIYHIDKVFDKLEKRLGFEKNTEPVMNMLRKYYHNDWLFDADGNLIEMYTSLKQGCAFAAFLSDVILYDLDEQLNNMCSIYIRYSDDMIILGKRVEEAKQLIDETLPKYGLKLNPKKVEKFTIDDWIPFLGFKIKGNSITLSKNRVKNFQREITARSISNRNITYWNAKKSIINYLYKGDYCWASACLGVVNCEPDLITMDNFIKDCLRACKIRDNKRKQHRKVGKIGINKIGGLGSVNNLSDKTILRGKGSSIKKLREETEKELENYLTMNCLASNIKISKPIYEACVRAL